MGDQRISHLSGGFGLVACVLTLAEFPLWRIRGVALHFGTSALSGIMWHKTVLGGFYGKT